MDYQAVRMPYIRHGQQTYRTYCLVDPIGWNLGLSQDSLLRILQGIGCKPIKFNFLESLRALVGAASYKRGAAVEQAPVLFDCSTLVSWVYSQIGVQLPRYAVEQSKYGKTVPLLQSRLGDLIFTKGRIPRIDKGIENGIGHVAIATGKGTMIHAKNSHEGVVEEPINSSCSKLDCFRGVKRILPSRGWYTVIVPNDLKIFYSSDLRWKVGSQLKR